MSTQQSGLPIALVLAADTNGLGALRSLRAAGIPAWVLAPSSDEIALASRIPLRKLVPDGNSHDALLAALEPVPDGSVLIPTSDSLVNFLEAHREQLGKRWRISLPPVGLGDLLIDKAVETARVAELGIHLPPTLHPLPATADELTAKLRLPIIVKPRSFAYSRALGRKNVILDSVAAAQQLLDRLGDQRDAVVAQEVIPGGDDELWVCNCTFGGDHSLLGAFTFQRLGTSPAHYGVTSLAVSRHNPEVIRQVEALGRGLGYVGPAMVEFKRVPRDGRYCYLETNPRLGMCNWFDTSAGVNNVALSYHVALGTDSIQPAGSQQEGIRMLDRLDDSWARRQEGASWGEVLRVWRDSRTPRTIGLYYAPGDPRPAVVTVTRRIRNLARAAMRKLTGSGKKRR